MWQELMTVLQQLNKEYGALRSLGEEKHRLLVSVNLAELEGLLKKESQHAARIAEMEARRKKVLAKLAGLEKKLRPDMKMAELFSAVSNPQTRASLEKVHKELSEQVEAVVRQNEINSILVHGALNAVNVKLNRVGGAKVEPAYGQGGKDVVSHRKNFEFRA
ncbi:MAG: flagellar protein FlgN [Selenomonadaceae bacterium]|nr:flagellar protein FlgN [Selenomonadaceae bacterium]